MAETKKTTTTKTTATKTATAKTATKTDAEKTTTPKTATTKVAKSTKASATKVESAEVVNKPIVKTTAKPVVKKVVATKTKKHTKPVSKNLKHGIKVTLIRSPYGIIEAQKRTLKALGLSKINSYNILPDNAQTKGMIFVVKHLVKQENV